MEMYGYQIIRETDLFHHGILGQKWGKQNGPPYPLDAKDHSSSEKKAGWRKSLNKIDSTKKKEYNLKEKSKGNRKLIDEDRKRLIKLGAGIAVGALAIGGAIYLTRSDKLQHLIINGKSEVNEMFGGSAKSIPKIGKSMSHIDAKMVARINSGDRIGRDINCFHTSCGYILNSLFGINCTALPFYGVDEASGMKTPGRTRQLFHAIFDGIEETICTQDSVSDALNKIPNSSTGVLHVKIFGARHFLNYEKDARGQTTFIDCQTNSIFDSQSPFDQIYSILDFSNARLSPKADDVLSNIVERID